MLSISVWNSPLLYLRVVHSFLLLSRMLLYKNTTLCLSICLPMGIWVVCTLELVQSSCLEHGRLLPSSVGPGGHQLSLQQEGLLGTGSPLWSLTLSTEGRPGRGTSGLELSQAFGMLCAPEVCTLRPNSGSHRGVRGFMGAHG